MPRPDPAIDLSDAEKRDLIALIQAGRPLQVIDIFGNDTMSLLPVSVG